MGYEIEMRLWVRPGEDAGFQDYGSRTVAIMARHGARLLDVARPDAVNGPQEILRLRFPSQEAFGAYREDPALAALSDLRARVVKKTEVTA
ncbi:DUF1330 domain-containing protein [Maritimibacter sp. DP1N21-5]|uniref:DUF1330 domain-containing protein n=1 Tax=Maritimibacter sp. DP1N21-5 TaxID=2836867 RepID=UPI001C488506|nr:DUF1330 domain-containing protein [Maritimibacter sp. DP1N21-5]MBV7407639.1 DUF1330 domain-containing protein [Maritimibacter sp. DP1N21-5]